MSVDLDADGRLVFMVGGLKVVSGQPVNSNNEFLVSLCRERNGMLKIYLNGELEQSAYNAAIVNPDVKRGAVIVNSSLGDAIRKLKIKNRALDYKENKMSEANSAIPFICATGISGLIPMKTVLKSCRQLLTSVSVAVQEYYRYPRGDMISGQKEP